MRSASYSHSISLSEDSDSSREARAFAISAASADSKSSLYEACASLRFLWALSMSSSAVPADTSAISSHDFTVSHSFLYMRATMPSRPKERVDSSIADIFPVALIVEDSDPVLTVIILGVLTVLGVDDLL